MKKQSKIALFHIGTLDNLNNETLCLGEAVTKFPPGVTKKPKSNYTHCTDVSQYKKVNYTSSIKKRCWPTIDKRNTTKTERRCINVTYDDCDLHLYTNCSLHMFPEEFNGTELVTLNFTKIECRQLIRNETHFKLVPHCHNVTRQNCVTKWDIKNGVKVCLSLFPQKQ